MPLADYDSTAANNTAISGTNIAEGCPPGGVNNAIRQIMADLASGISSFALTVLDDTSASAMRTTLGAAAGGNALDSIAALTPAADKLPYYTGASAAALTGLSSFMRTVLDDADAAAARTTLGAIGVAAKSLSNPGYIKFQVGASEYFMVAWGSASINGNGYTSVNYSAAFPTASFAVVTGTGTAGNAGAQDNNPEVTACSTSGFTVWNADLACTGFYVAVGY